MITPQLSPDPIVPLTTQAVGPGTDRPIYLTPDQVAAWIWSYKTWRLDASGTIDGNTVSVQGASLTNNNLSAPTAQTSLVVPGSVGMVQNGTMGDVIMTVTLNTQRLIHDQLNDVYWPLLRFDFNTGASSVGSISAGTTPVTIAGIPVPLYGGSIAPDTVVELTPSTTW